MTELTLPKLKTAAAQFIKTISGKPIPDLFGSTDGKAVGTYVEQAFNHYLRSTYDYIPGNAALGIDFHANQDDIIAYLEERNLPLDEIGRYLLAERILQTPPQLGYLTISNALQWRLQYSRIIDIANLTTDPGVENLLV